MYRLIIVSIIFSFATFSLVSQTKKDLWIFGKGASLKFDNPSATPYPLNADLLINSKEAAATGFDSNGNLLFYSDGESIWNYNNVEIYSQLKGNTDATQGITVFIPQNIDSLFYLVTQNLSTRKLGSFIYTLDFRTNPNGVISSKINFLENSQESFERLEIIPHYNRKDNWIILNPHYPKDSEYLVYLFDGIKVELVSTFKSEYKRNFNDGYLKASPNGKYLVSADIDGNSIEMVEFDNQFGKIYNPKVYSSKKLDAGVYGIEFSENSKYLYLTIHQHISGNKSKSLCLQLDFNSIYYTDNDITYEVYNLVYIKNDGGMWGIKRAINNQIYIARNNKNYLSVIRNPNLGGLQCSFKENGPNITTNNDLCYRGLPSTVAMNNTPDYEIIDIKRCVDGFINYIPEFDIDYSQYHWLGNNMVRDSKNLVLTNLELDDSGLYYLTNKITNKVIVAVRLTVGALREFEIIASPSNIVCYVDSISLKPDSKFEYYEWSTGETDSIIFVNESGSYSLKATTEYGCEFINEINVYFVKSPEFEIKSELIDCNNTYKLTCTEDFDNYNWSTGDTTKSIVVHRAGEYELTVELSEQCKTTKTIVIDDIKKNIDLIYPNGLFICEDEIIEVEIINVDSNCIYNWSNGSRATKTAYTEPGKEYIEATDTTTGCVFRKEFEILSQANFVLQIEPIYDCENNTIKLTSNADTNSFDYLWSNGSTDYLINAEAEKTYFLIVKSKYKSCTFSDTLKVINFNYEKLELEFPGGKYICSDDTLAVKIKNPNQDNSYLWSNGKQDTLIYISNPGNYSVTKTNGLTKCKETIYFEIKELYDFNLKIVEQFDCSISTTILSTNTSSEIFDFEWSNGNTNDTLYVTEAGKYSLKITTNNGCEFFDTILVERVRSFDLEITSFPSDTICAPGTVVLKIDSISPKIISKRWSNGSRKDSIIVDKSGQYIIEANDKNYCYVRDTVFVEIITPPEIDIKSSNGLTICQDNQTVLSVTGLDNISNYHYSWSNGSISPSIVVSQSGEYTVIVTAKGTTCFDSSSILIGIKQKPTLDITGDREFCDGSSTILYGDYSDGQIYWSNGSTEDSIIVYDEGLYFATVIDSIGCETSDSITVKINPLPVFDIDGNNTICTGDTTILTCSDDFESYQWSDLSTGKSLVVTKAGTYTLRVWDKKGCSNSKDFEVFEENNSFNITNTQLLKDSILTNETNTVKFNIVNQKNSDNIINVNSDFYNERFRIDANQTKQIVLNIQDSKLGKNTVELDISNEGNCKKDTTLRFEYEAYTILEAILPNIFYPNLNEKVSYSFDLNSTIPLVLELSYNLNLQSSIFFTDTNLEVVEQVNINNKITHNVEGLTLLGSPSKQPTYFNSIETNNPYVIIDTSNGSIEVGKVCLNDNRLVVFDLFKGIEFYPNPASEYLTLDIIDDKIRNVKVKIMNLFGKVINEFEFEIEDSQMLNITDLESGVYILNLKSNNWEKSFRFNKIK